MTAGQEAELRAANHLTKLGWQIIEQNYRCRAGELDLVCSDGETLVFVEVRSRADRRFGGPQVAAVKQQQVTRVAQWYLVDRSPLYATMRFDVITITGRQLEHIKDAWRVGLC